MNISHTVRIPTNIQYEMKHFTFSMTTEDLPVELVKELTHVQIWRSMEYIVQREIINLQLQGGFMSIDEAQTRLEYLRQCLGDAVQEKLVKHGC